MTAGATSNDRRNNRCNDRNNDMHNGRQRERPGGEENPAGEELIDKTIELVSS